MIAVAQEPNVARVRLQMHQWLAAISCASFIALVTGLGGGKTWFGARWIIWRAIAFPDSIHLVTINSYSQAEDVVIPALEEAAEEMGLRYFWKHRDKRPTLFIDVGNGLGEIRVRSTEHPNRLRGPEYGSWWADEVRDAKPAAVPVAIGRLRCKKVDTPKYLWTTTPNGHDEIWRRHVKPARLTRREVDARTGLPISVYETPDGKRALINCDTRLNAFVPSDYGSTLAENLDDRLLQQERGGEFVSPAGRFYYSFERERNVSDLAVYDPREPLIVALDFNVFPDVAVLIQERAGKTLVVDEITAWRGGTNGVIDIFLARYPDRLFNRAPIIYGDASGARQDTRSGMSDYAFWTERVKGCILRVPKANGLVRDRQNAMNARAFNEARKSADLLINPKCEDLLADLDQVKPKPDGSIDKDNNKTTHWTDALGYYVVLEHPCLITIDRSRFAAEDRRLWSK